MKKLYLLLIFILSVSESHSQAYIPMLDSIYNNWYFTANVIPVRTQQQSPACWYGFNFGISSHRYTAGDTLIGSKAWKILDSQDFGQPWSVCRYGYIREDTAARKIYFMDNSFNPEVVLYDFSLQVGDTITRNFYQPGGFFPDGVYYVDSITTVNINAGVRRLFYLNNHQPFQPSMQWIESVGHPGDLAYLYSCNMFGGFLSWNCNEAITHDFCMLLTCFEHAGQKVYFDSCAHSQALNNSCFFYADSCNYWNICTSLPENSLIHKFEITPNPASNNVTLLIESERISDAVLEIFSMEGNRISEQKININQGKNALQIDPLKLPANCYLVELKTNTGSLFRKLILLE